MTITRILAGPVRAFVWTFDLCSSDGSPSLSKGIAAAVAIVTLRDAWLTGFSVLNVSAMALALSAAFGRSVFMNWLNRNSWSARTDVSLSGDAAAVVEAVSAARDRARGIDPA